MQLLVVGWSFNERELLDALTRDGGRVDLTILADPTPLRAALPSELPAGITLRRLEGVTMDPAELRRALRESQPEVILVAATPTAGDLLAAQSSAVLTILQLRRLVGAGGAPIVGDLFLPREGSGLQEDDGVVVVASLELLALGLGISVLDPPGAAAWEGLLSGEETRLEVRDFAPADGREASFAGVYQGLLKEGAVPLSLAPAGGAAQLGPPPDATVRPGDQLLVVQRRDALPAAAGDDCA